MKTAAASVFFFFGIIISLGGNPLLNAAEGLVKQNPFQAYQILKSLDLSSLSPEARLQYHQILQELMFFRLPIHKIGLSDANILSIASDGEDLWLGDRLGGISRYNLSSGEVLNIRQGRPSQISRTINHILAEENQIWITADDALITYDKKSGSVNTLNNPNPRGQPLMLIRFKDTLYLAMKNLGLYQWNGETFTPSPLNHESLASCQVLFVYNNTLWAGTENGLFYLEEASWHPVKHFARKNITAASADAQTFWIAVREEGLYVYNPDENNFKFILPDSPHITALCTAEKILFAGMYKGGIAEILQGKSDDNRLNSLSPALLRVGSLAYHNPYLIVGTLGDALFFIHRSLF